MKKFLSTIILNILLLSLIVVPVQATETEMTKLQLEVLEAKESYEIYMLLPRTYITYAIKHDGLNIKYEGVNTLKYNTIPSIAIDTNNIQDEEYIEDGIEYTQIKIENFGTEIYTFDIISEYTEMDMVFRFKSESKDYILHLDNFTVEDNLCKIQYNYEKDTLKSEKKTTVKVKFNLEWWQAVLIIGIVLGIVYIYNRRNS